MATYFDPNCQSKVDYTNVKKVLDDVVEAPSPGPQYDVLLRQAAAWRSEGCLLRHPSHAGDRTGPSSTSATE